MARKKSEFGPNLGSILQGAPAALVRQFLASFKRPDDTLLAPPEITEVTPDDQGKAALSSYLRSEDKEIIGLLEGIAGALLDMGQDKGATSLETVAGQRLQNVDYDQYESQPDLLCKSIWMRTVFPMHFHDAQSFYAARRYRERRTYYTCCEVDFDHASVADTDGIPDEKLCDAVQEALGLKGKVTASVLELPETANYPPSFMVALRHPGPLSSIDNHREEGGWTVHYYRPSHEAVLIYTPQLKKIEVASASSDVREKTSKVFAEVVLGRPPSAKPLTRREFNLERFRSSFDLDCPDLDDVEITMAAVVEAEVRLGSWGRRLNIKVTIKDKMEDVVQKYVSNSANLIRSFGFTKIAIAIGYTRRSDGKEGTFRVSISDGSSSDVQSMRDPFLRDLGFRLLEHWGITQNLRTLTDQERAQWFGFLLSLYDLPDDTVAGAFFISAGVDPARLVSARLIARKGRQLIGLAEDDDEVVEVEQQTGPEPGTVRQTGSFGEADGLRLDTNAIEYGIDRAWLAETILKAIAGSLGISNIETINEFLVSLGPMALGERKVPLYLARRLADLKARESVETVLRSRHTAGPGLVLAVSDEPPQFLGPNVVIALRDLLLNDGSLGDLDREEMARRFEANRTLATSAQVAQVVRHTPRSGTLIIPGLEPLTLDGANQIQLFESLVEAATDGTGQRLTKVLMDGMGSDNPRQLFSSGAWAKAHPTYIRHGSSNRYWRLGDATDTA
ncbi:hypothetical protein [Rhodovulum visakhapatnamense]|uniref:Uncharacterized protein n=1 Tax=Rhodovulum visakhapatnamense TaxID=364297 RepID=A0A4R8FJC2_9RHOB|nr:hypothetical protein [Rhodovulum visakhapatnamense]TDX26256.1 hypothetical protein EV657_11730 [Rhodovulum visakhapatnamense]